MICHINVIFLKVLQPDTEMVDFQIFCIDPEDPFSQIIYYSKSKTFEPAQKCFIVKCFKIFKIFINQSSQIMFRVNQIRRFGAER